jgi:hypothetical protein
MCRFNWAFGNDIELNGVDQFQCRGPSSTVAYDMSAATALLPQTRSEWESRFTTQNLPAGVIRNPQQGTTRVDKRISPHHPHVEDVLVVGSGTTYSLFDRSRHSSCPRTGATDVLTGNKCAKECRRRPPVRRNLVCSAVPGSTAFN